MNIHNTNTNFFQIFRRYEIEWVFNGERITCSLNVNEDDLQAVLRSVMATHPDSKITITPAEALSQIQDVEIANG